MRPSAMWKSQIGYCRRLAQKNDTVHSSHYVHCHFPNNIFLISWFDYRKITLCHPPALKFSCWTQAKICSVL